MLDEYISIEAARERYAVVVTGTVEDCDIDIDVGKTKDLRRQRLAAESGENAR